MKADDLSSPLLQKQTFKIFTEADTSSISTLSFDDEFIYLKSKSEAQKYLLHDLIGFNQKVLEAGRIQFKVNLFPKIKKIFRKLKRYVQQFVFWVKMDEDQIENLRVTLLKRITNRQVKLSSNKLKLMIYFNPNAGSNSRKHFQNIIDFIRLTNFTFDVLQTQYRNHCKEHLATLEVDNYQAAIIVSGDGLMHQFVNSVAVQKLAVSHVPAGSGNAFSKTQTQLSEEDCTDEVSIFLVVKGRRKQMNLTKMQLQKEVTPIYSLLSLEWAFLADVDMNSEFLRCIGGLRFEVYSLYRCIALQRYHGKLTYSKTSIKLPPLNEQIQNNEDFEVLETDFLHTIFSTIPYVSDKFRFSPLLKVQDQAIDMQTITLEQGRWQLVKYLLNSDAGTHFDLENHTQKQGFNFNYANLKSFRLEPLGENLGIFGIDGQSYEAQKIQVSMAEIKITTF